MKRAILVREMNKDCGVGLRFAQKDGILGLSNSKKRIKTSSREGLCSIFTIGVMEHSCFLVTNPHK